MILQTFFYFAFGSNLLASRLHIENPSAEPVDVGKLMHYRLDFNVYPNSTRWAGAVATVVPTQNLHLYGYIWEIDMKNMQDLDNQEGVNRGIYTPITVPIYSLNKKKFIKCRTYVLVDQPKTILQKYEPEETPYHRQPSKTYLQTIVKGAVEDKLPRSYICWLRSIKHNGNVVPEFEKKFNLTDVELYDY